MKKQYLNIIFIVLFLLISLAIYLFFFASVGRGTLPVINYHSVQESKEDEDEYVVEQNKFESMIRLLVEEGFTFLSLQDVEAIIYHGQKLPDNPILITFDDGYVDNYKVVFPILKKYQAHASIFIIGSRVGEEGYLTWDQIKEMSESQLVDFGNHSYNLHDRFKEGPHKGKTFLSTPLEGESEQAYFSKIKDDLIWNNHLIFESSSFFPNAIAYPGAMVNDFILQASKEAGIQIGFVGGNLIASKIKEIDPYQIHRFHMNASTNIKWKVRFLKSNNEEE